MVKGLVFFFYLDLDVEDSCVEGWLSVWVFFLMYLGVEVPCVEGWLRDCFFFFFILTWALKIHACRDG